IRHTRSYGDWSSDVCSSDLPFLVLATQNPIESEGLYAQPEAQRDRFLTQLLIKHPSFEEETEIARRMSVHPPEAEQVLSTETLRSEEHTSELQSPYDLVCRL